MQRAELLNKVIESGVVSVVRAESEIGRAHV